MRRRRNGFRKEKIIMISASAFVLTALTMAGVYVREQSKENDEYRVDLSELDGQNVSDKTSEIAEQLNATPDNVILADDLDADPDFWEVDSPKVESQLENIATGEKVTAEEAGESDKKETVASGDTETSVVSTDNATTNSNAVAAGEMEDESMEMEAGAEAVAANYNFPAEMQLRWPLYGDLIMNYSMDKTIYFETLGQYRYNPALVIKAEVGSQVVAGANGIVKAVGKSTELGNNVVIDIGEGYELTYGQLENIAVTQGQIVETETLLGTVANPSVYYSSEGSNVYLKLTKDGIPVNPMDVLP